MPLPPTQNLFARSLVAPLSPGSIHLGPHLHSVTENQGHRGAAPPQLQANEGLGNHDEEDRRQRRLLTSRRWRREQTVFKNVNDIATKMKTRAYLIFQHEGEEKVQVYNSHPTQDCITDFKYLMEFKYPRPLLRTPETMAEMLATKRREAEPRLLPAANLVPKERLCKDYDIPSKPSNEARNGLSSSAPTSSSPIAARADTEKSIDDDPWSGFDEDNMPDWYDDIWQDEGDHVGNSDYTRDVCTVEQPKTPTLSKMAGNAGGYGHLPPRPSATVCTPHSTHTEHAKHATSHLHSILDLSTKQAASKPRTPRLLRSGVRKTRSQSKASRRLHTSRG